MPTKKFDRGVSMLGWAYNEEASIIDYLERATTLLEASVEDYEIVLVDDGSTDGTYELARQFQKKNPRLRIYRNEKNLNVGYSSRRAINLAEKEFLFWQTVDWCYDISDLRISLEYLKDFDIVQGVRRRPVKVRSRMAKPLAILFQLFGVKHLTKRSDTIQKAIVSVVNYMLIRLLFRVPLSDYQNVTFYRTSYIQTLKYEARSSFANPEALIKSYWKGMSFKEIPISFLPRQKGEAKGTKTSAIMTSVKDILGLWFKWVVLGKRGKVTKGHIERIHPAALADQSGAFAENP